MQLIIIGSFILIASIISLAVVGDRRNLPVKKNLTLTDLGWARVNQRLATGGGGWYIGRAA